MSVTHSSTLSFEDYVGKRTTCRVDLVPDLVTAKSLASALAGWTYAKAVAATHCEKDNEEQGMATEHTGFDSVNVKAQMFFEDTDTGKTIKLELPCPSETIFEHSSKNQYTVIKAKGDAIAMDLQVATGRNLRFLKGTKIENRTRPQV